MVMGNDISLLGQTFPYFLRGITIGSNACGMIREKEIGIGGPPKVKRTSIVYSYPLSPFPLSLLLYNLLINIKKIKITREMNREMIFNNCYLPTVYAISLRGGRRGRS